MYCVQLILSVFMSYVYRPSKIAYIYIIRYIGPAPSFHLYTWKFTNILSPSLHIFSLPMSIYAHPLSPYILMGDENIFS